MVRFIYILLFTFLTTSSNSQQIYKRHWGTLYPTKTTTWPNKLTIPPRIDTSRYRNYSMVYSLNKASNKLYVLEDLQALPKVHNTNVTIYEFNESNNQIKNITTNLIYASQILHDKSNNMYIIGKLNNGASGLFKCDTNGNTTFITNVLGDPTKSSVTFDHYGNIYTLGSAYKTTVLSPSFFQSTGDHNSILNLQDVISKYDSKGKHIWSTFYFNNQSHIWGIAAGINGLYVYGHEFLTTSNSSYFGTANGHQPKATGIYSNGDPNSAKNVFLSKFNFDGTRAWSTYYGTQQSMVPMQTTVAANKSMEVIGDDIYIITDHILPQGINNKLNTANVAINTTPDITNAKTLTKFSGDGKRIWASYLYDAETLNITTDDNIMLSGTNILLNNLPLGTLDAYQKSLKGTEDNITYIISNNGSNLNYLSYYGDYLRENGIAVPSKNGYYILGGTTDYPSRSSTLNTANAKYTKLEKIDTYYNPYKYVGNFVGFFTKTLSNENHELTTDFTKHIKIYPNPTTDVLTIDSNILLSYDSKIIIYDLSGKKIMDQKITDQYKNTINVGHLPTNVYILEIGNESERYQTKIIKK